MTLITHREMRNNSAEVLRRVQSGESFTVTNNGEPVAQIGPVEYSTLDDLAAKGRLRRAVHDAEALRTITRVSLDGDTSSADVIADLRGYDRDR